MPQRTKPIPPLTDEEKKRFWSKVDRRSDDECWDWQGANNGEKGYGQLTIRGSHLYAHRLAFALTHADPGDLQVCHKCDNPLCCNPAHHFLGTNADNVADMREKGRARGGAIHPLRGTARYNAKLTADEVRSIRRAEGLNLSELGRRFGVAAATIRDILIWRTWKHIA